MRETPTTAAATSESPTDWKDQIMREQNNTIKKLMYAVIIAAAAAIGGIVTTLMQELTIRTLNRMDAEARAFWEKMDREESLRNRKREEKTENRLTETGAELRGAERTIINLTDEVTEFERLAKEYEKPLPTPTEPSPFEDENEKEPK